MRLRLTRDTGMLIVAVWFLLYGLLFFVPGIPFAGPLLALLAIVAAVLILMRR